MKKRNYPFKELSWKSHPSLSTATSPARMPVQASASFRKGRGTYLAAGHLTALRRARHAWGMDATQATVSVFQVEHPAMVGVELALMSGNPHCHVHPQPCPMAGIFMSPEDKDQGGWGKRLAEAVKMDQLVHLIIKIPLCCGCFLVSIHMRYILSHFVCT